MLERHLDNSKESKIEASFAHLDTVACEGLKDVRLTSSSEFDNGNSSATPISMLKNAHPVTVNRKVEPQCETNLNSQISTKKEDESETPPVKTLAVLMWCTGYVCILFLPSAMGLTGSDWLTLFLIVAIGGGISAVEINKNQIGCTSQKNVITVLGKWLVVSLILFAITKLAGQGIAALLASHW